MHFTSPIVLGLSGLVAASPVEVMGRQASTLAAAMIAAGRQYIGTSLTIRGDTQETNLIKTQFNAITPENAMKWDATEPNQNSFSFSDADQVVQFAQQNKDYLRCHTLVWYSQLPSWVSNINDNKTLIAAMTNHIQTVMGRYKGKCTHWDVVNEALNDDGTYRSNVFLSVIGEAYIPIAFKVAAAADPNAKLFYNDYNLEYNANKTAAAANIVKLVQSYGQKINGVGFQGHLVSEPTPTQSDPTPDVDTLTAALKTMTDLGVVVAYTELDIRMNTPSTPAKLQVQADCYTRVVQSCMNVPQCVGITLWGVTDKYSWVPQTFNGEGAALLWDENYNEKPAYTAFLDALQAPTNTTASS